VEAVDRIEEEEPTEVRQAGIQRAPETRGELVSDLAGELVFGEEAREQDVHGDVLLIQGDGFDADRIDDRAHRALIRARDREKSQRNESELSTEWHCFPRARPKDRV
jgi:hypothetical protein